MQKYSVNCNLRNCGRTAATPRTPAAPFTCTQLAGPQRVHDNASYDPPAMLSDPDPGAQGMLVNARHPARSLLTSPLYSLVVLRV